MARCTILSLLVCVVLALSPGPGARAAETGPDCWISPELDMLLDELRFPLSGLRHSLRPMTDAPREIETLIEMMARLPGLGPRSARRAVLHLIRKRGLFMQPLAEAMHCLLYTSPSPRDQRGSRMPSSA